MKTIDLINSISKDDIILMDLYKELPDVAKRTFLIDIVSSELQSTNEIEGVSSKEELVSTTKEVLKGENYSRSLRFSNISNSYLQLQKDNLKRPKNFKDIRRIYDEITIDGVEKEDLAHEKSKNDPAINKDETLLTITNISIELSLFGLNDYLDIELLKDILGLSEQTLRLKLNKLVGLGVLEKISKNPIRCILNKSYLES